MTSRAGLPTNADRGALRRRMAPLALALVSAALFAAVYLVADRTLVGQRVDDWAFLVVFDVIPGGWPAQGLAWFARSFVVAGLATTVAVLAVVALVHRRWSGLTRAAVVVGVSVLLTPYLRDEVLVRAQLQKEAFPLNSMPSTHAAAAVALTWAALTLWPRQHPRPWWVDRVATVVVVLVALGNVISQAHRPSDVVASFLVVGAVAAVVDFASGRPAGHPPPDHRPSY